MTTMVEFVRNYMTNKSARIPLFKHDGITVKTSKNITVCYKYKGMLFINPNIEAKQMTTLLKQHALLNNLIIVEVSTLSAEPNIDEIRENIKQKLLYYNTHQTELVNNSIREQYMALYEDFKQIMYKHTKSHVTPSIRALYKQIQDEKYMKQLRKQIAIRTLHKK